MWYAYAASETESYSHYYYYYYYYYFNQGKPPGGSKITKGNYEICLVVINLLWPVVVNKTVMQQNRIKTLHHNGNPLE